MADVWEYNENLDTAKSFQAFCIYRDLGQNRTIDDAYSIYKGLARGTKKAVGFFQRWATHGKWVDRTKAFDLEQTRLRMLDSSLEARKKHENRLEEVRSITEEISLTRLESALESAKLVRDTIVALKKSCKKTMNEGGVMVDRFIMDDEDAAFLLTLVSVQNKDAGSIEAALKLADESLNISGLIDSMKRK